MKEYQKYSAEALGTFTLTLVVALSLVGQFPVATPLLAAITLGLFVYSIGHISGAHINPAVTIGIWSLGKIKTSEALKYLIFQSIGAFVAMIIAKSVLGSSAALTVSDSLMVGMAEMSGTFFFTFGIASVVYKRTPSPFAGIIIGFSLLLGIAFAALMGSNGILNPAVAFGIRSINLMYLLGPIIGSISGMNIYRLLSENK